MFAALHFPDFQVTAALRASPGDRHLPAVLISAGSIEDPKAKLPVLSANHHARNLGIRSGWPLGRALVRSPGLRILAAQPEAERELLGELIDLAESLTPDYEITAPDTLVLDITRMPRARLAWLEEFEIPHAELWHVRAPTPDLAHLAVRHEESQGGLLDPGYFARLPILLLASMPGIPELLDIIRLWGLRALGDFMKLPRQELIDRLGPAAGHAHDVLHGKACRLLRLHRPPASLEQSYDFEDPVHLAEPLVFIAKRLLHTLSSRIAASYLAVAALEFTLQLESGARLERSIRLPEPLVDAAELLRPIQTFLESVQLESPVTGMELDATTTAPNPVQREWFGRQLPNPTRWADTLARLEALVGRDNIGIPVPGKSHRPDTFRLQPPLSPESGKAGTETAFGLPSVPLCRFRPPRPIAIASRHHPRVPIPHAVLAGPHAGEILARRGPFLLSGDWWDEGKSWERVEWDVQFQDRSLVRLAYSPPGHWQLEGIYS